MTETTTYKDLIDILITSLQGASTIKDVQTACEAYIGQLRERYTLTSIHKYLTQARKAVDSAFPDGGEFGFYHDKEARTRHEAINYLVKSHDEKEAWKSHNTGIVTNTQTNQYWLTNPQAIIDRAIEGLDSEYYSYIAASLIVLSGRRPVEVLKTGDFEVRGTKLFFTGQAKTKGRTGKDLGFEIPVLCNAKKFVEAFQRLRLLKDCSEMTNDDVNRRVENKVNDKVKRVYGVLNPGIKGCSDLRKVYAAIVYHLYKTQRKFVWVTKTEDYKEGLEDNHKKGFNEYQFFKAILGHGEKESGSTQNYQKFEVKEADNDLR